MWSRGRGKGTSNGALRPLAWRWVVLYAVVAFGIGLGVIWWLWPPPLESQTEAIKARAEAVRTGLVAAGAAGAVFTLWLAVRRQHSTETMDAATRHDAEQRRMTELYTAAAEQLGHERPAVRLAGLYALQRLGQVYPDHRRTIVNVWCAYLRMPFRDPDSSDAGEEERAERRQELEVRVAVQRLLREHVHSGPYTDRPASPHYWGDDLEVDLTGAALYNLELHGRTIHPHTSFFGATFRGTARFDHADLVGDGWLFAKATFHDAAYFDHATFRGNVRFEAATFHDMVRFEGAAFHDGAWFVATTFHKGVVFEDATFHQTVLMYGARALYSGTRGLPPGWDLEPLKVVPPEEEDETWWKRLVAIVPAASSGEEEDDPAEVLGQPASHQD